MDATNGKAYIFDCRYSTLCRQIVTDDEGRIQEFDFETDDALVTLKVRLSQNEFMKSLISKIVTEKFEGFLPWKVL